MTEADRARRSRTLDVAVIGVPALVMAIFAVMSSVRLPLWRDEVATLSFASLSTGELGRAVSHVDAVLTPYYFVAHLAHSILPSDLGLRLPSILAATATVVVAGMLARRWWGRFPALVAGIVLVTNPLAVEMASTARPYALAAFFVVAAAAFLDRALSPGRHTGAWIGYGVCAAGVGLMHLLAALTIPAMAMLVLGARRNKVVAWAVCTVVAALTVLPIALAALSQTEQVSWIPRPTLRSAIGSLASVSVFRADGRLGFPEAIALLFITAALCTSLIFTLRLRPRQTRLEELRRFAFAIAIVLFPWGFLLAESLVATPYLRTTYLMPTVIGLALGLAAAAHRLRAVIVTHERRSSARVGGASAIAVLLCVPILIAASVTATALRAPWRIDDFAGLADSMRASLSVGDTVVLVQHYSETGVDAGIARTIGDRSLAADSRRNLIAGTQATLDVRQVVTLQPFTTKPAEPPAPGSPVSLVYTRGGFGNAEVKQLAARGIACTLLSKLPASAAFGILRFDESSCRGEAR